MALPTRRQLRRLLPRPARQRLYDWNPSRRRRWAAAPGLITVPAESRAALTFDDGPDEECTPRLLDVLAEQRSKATFFVVGERVVAQPELTAEIVARGHELGLHGMTHRRHDRLAPAEATDDLRAGIEAIERAAGVRPRRYRPPYGASSPALASTCAELDLQLSYWSAWGHDWESIGARHIARLVLRDLTAGAIVLLHDSARYAEREDAEPTVDSIPIIAGSARGRGIDLASMKMALDGTAG